MKVDVIILAGAENKGPLQECSSISYEALIEINGLPMVEYVIQAVQGAETVERIAVVGPVDMLQSRLSDQVDFLVQSKDSIIANIQEGIHALGAQRNILILTSDIPLINSLVIDQFIQLCEQRKADCYYPIVSKEANLSRFPGTKRTYARLKEGIYTGGNIFVLNPQVINGAAQFINKLVTYRKKPIKLSQLFGIKFIVKFVLGRLKIRELEERVEKLTGFSAAALVLDYPEIGFDVDKPSDLMFMEDYIQKAT